MFQLSKLSLLRKLVALTALVLIALSWWQVTRATEGLTVEQFTVDGLPLRYVAPAGNPNEQIPGVIIAHGFSGSQQLMLGYSYTLAHAGFATLSLDFGGHASNPAPLDQGRETLQRNMETAYAALIAQPFVADDRVAALGHSMGSGAVMEAGLQDPENYHAILALSPTDAGVEPNSPPNLYFQAGELEPRFAANAERLLLAAGDRNDAFAAGLARDFDIIPGVEHLSILFHPQSHALALEWLQRSLGQPLIPSTYTDRRIGWYGLHLVGVMGLLLALAPGLSVHQPSQAEAPCRRRWHWVALLVAPVVASALLVALSSLISLRSLGGILVGGTLSVWFALFGLTWLLLGFRLPRPRGTDILWGLLLFGVLTLALGVMGQLVWLPWWMIPSRLIRWPFFLVASLPWLWAASLNTQHVSVGKRWLWWLAHTVVVVAGLILAVQLIPDLSFLMLIIPQIPLLTGLMALGDWALRQRPLAAALGNAAFFGWITAVIFPLASLSG